MNSSFTGYLREPLSTECSRMWATPVSSEGKVRNVTAKLLFSSLIGQRQHLRARAAVPEEARGGIQFGNGLLANKFEACMSTRHHQSPHRQIGTSNRSKWWRYGHQGRLLP